MGTPTRRCVICKVWAWGRGGDMKGEGTQIVATDTEDRKEESGDKDGTRERHKKTHTSSKHNESAELPHKFTIIVCPCS